MITSLILFGILYLYSIYDIRKKSKNKNEQFNPFNTNICLHAVFITHTAVLIFSFIYLIITYLP